MDGVYTLSFSSTVKNELCRIEINGKCCLLSELAAVVRISGVTNPYGTGNEGYLRIITENAAFARKIYSTVKKIYNILPEVIIRKNRKLKKHVSYILVVASSSDTKKIFSDLIGRMEEKSFIGEQSLSLYPKKILHKSCCKKSFLRGAFLAGGSISDPEKTYHLEITAHNIKLAKEINELINSFSLNAKVIKRKGSYVVYLKEGENIVDFLNIIGAHSALLELENIRILKEMRNNVNRVVNCETANLDKTINASIRQIENIKYIKEHIGFGHLPESLSEIAEMRLEYSDANLKELGEMLDPPLGKSGVNHRLRKLDKIAEKLRNLKEDFTNG